MIEVLRDNLPKVNQEYSLELDNIVTEGVRQTGRAVLSEFNAEAILTIEGGNDPHGVFSFALNSLRRFVDEADTVLSLSIDRKFGAIGKFIAIHIRLVPIYCGVPGPPHVCFSVVIWICF